MYNRESIHLVYITCSLVSVFLCYILCIVNNALFTAGIVIDIDVDLFLLLHHSYVWGEEGGGL